MKNKGFTLLEILLVIAVIVILASIVLVSINPNRQIAQVRNAERVSEINSIYKALEQYSIDVGNYPSVITTSLQDICINGNTINCVNLGVLVPDYIASIPIDPQGVAYKVGLNAISNKIILYTNGELGKQIVLGGSLWSPSGLESGLNLWFDANDSNTTILNGNRISQWNDKSGNNRNVNQATSSSQPTLSNINQNNALSFNNSSLLAVNPTISWNILNPFTIFVVASANSVPGGLNYIIDNSSRTIFGIGNSNPQVLALNNGSSWINGNVNLISNQPFIGTGIANNSASSVSLNGLVGPAGLASNNGISTNFRIGSHYGGSSSFWNGKIGEIIIIQGFDSSNIQKIEGYLAWKWGLVNNLPISHIYKTFPPIL